MPPAAMVPVQVTSRWKRNSAAISWPGSIGMGTAAVAPSITVALNLDNVTAGASRAPAAVPSAEGPVSSGLIRTNDADTGSPAGQGRAAWPSGPGPTVLPTSPSDDRCSVPRRRIGEVAPHGTAHQFGSAHDRPAGGHGSVGSDRGGAARRPVQLRRRHTV